MVKCRDLRNLVLRIAKDRGIEYADAMYIWSLVGDVHGERCFSLRYGNSKPFMEALQEVYRVCGRRNVTPRDRTSDGFRVCECISKPFEDFLAKELELSIKRKFLDSSDKAKVLVLLLYAEGSIPSTGTLRLIDVDLYTLMRIPMKLLGIDITESEFAKVLDEVIATGLILESVEISKRHIYRIYIAPKYSLSLWTELPGVIGMKISCNILR